MLNLSVIFLQKTYNLLLAYDSFDQISFTFLIFCCQKRLWKRDVKLHKIECDFVQLPTPAFSRLLKSHYLSHFSLIILNELLLML